MFQGYLLGSYVSFLRIKDILHYVDKFYVLIVIFYSIW